MRKLEEQLQALRRVQTDLFLMKKILCDFHRQVLQGIWSVF